MLGQGFWQIPLDSVNTGASSAVQNVQAAIDTGTTLIVAPQQEAIQLYLAIPGAKDASNVIGPGFFTCEIYFVAMLKAVLT